MSASLNQGVDWAGNSIGRPTNFLIACAVNPMADDLDYELDWYYQKVEAGADFAVTQPLYDMAQLDRFMSRLRRLKERKGDLLVQLCKSDLERHVEAESFRRLCAASYVSHHPGAVLELHYGNRVRSLESRDRSMRNDVTVKRRPAARGECLDLCAGALGTEGTGRKISMRAMDTSLKSQFSLSRAFPEVGSLGGGDG